MPSRVSPLLPSLLKSHRHFRRNGIAASSYVMELLPRDAERLRGVHYRHAERRKIVADQFARMRRILHVHILVPLYSVVIDQIGIARLPVFKPENHRRALPQLRPVTSLRGALQKRNLPVRPDRDQA